MSSFAAVFANPPNPNESVPLYNEHATIYGSTLPFHILSWAAVCFRLYIRFRVVRNPGWDDFLIAVAALLNLTSLITFYIGVHYGLGQHLFSIDPGNFINLGKAIYVQNASYFTCSGIIKLSLLAQYLRIFREGTTRQVCIAFLALTSLWTCFWTFAGWVPCFPVSGVWNRFQNPPPKCWGIGFGSVESALLTFVTFAATNMTLDTIIFFLPMSMYLKAGLNSRQIISLLALFSLGSIVLITSIVRLWTAIRFKSADISVSLDYTWWYSLTMILSSLEIDFAIVSASIPIFWPAIVASLPQIFVTQEVRVSHHQRLGSNNNLDYELGRTCSVKSNGSDSRRNLTDYSDPYVIEHVTGMLENSAKVEGQMQKGKR